MKKLAIALTTLVAICVAALLIFSAADYYSRHHRKVIIETLTNPIYIRDIGTDAVTSTANMKISIPNIETIPKLPGAIQRDLFRYGVERTSSGECFGLFRVHHWCGNDPVGYHLARINLSSLFTVVDTGIFRCTTYGIDPGSYSWVQSP